MRRTARRRLVARRRPARLRPPNTPNPPRLRGLRAFREKFVSRDAGLESLTSQNPQNPLLLSQRRPTLAYGILLTESRTVRPSHAEPSCRVRTASPSPAEPSCRVRTASPSPAPPKYRVRSVSQSLRRHDARRERLAGPARVADELRTGARSRVALTPAWSSRRHRDHPDPPLPNVSIAADGHRILPAFACKIRRPQLNANVGRTSDQLPR
jgi:hypothetical protein